MQIPNQTQKLQRLWQRLTAPSEEIEDENQLLQANTLSGLSLSILFFSIFVVIIWVLANPQFTAAPYISAAILTSLLMIYCLSRSQYYQVGSYLLIGLVIGAIIAIMLTADGPMPERMLALNFLAVAILFAVILTTRWTMILVTLICLTIAGAYFFVPSVPFNISFSTFVFMGIMSGLLILTANIRLGYIHRLQEIRNVLRQERDLFVSGPVAVIKWPAGNKPIEYVSPNITEMLGYTAEQFLSDEISYDDIVHPDDHARVHLEVAHSKQEQAHQIPHTPYRLLRRDGRSVWVLDNTTILRDRDGEITNFYGYIVDITAQKEVEEAFQASEKRLDLAINAANLGVWDWDIRNGKIIVNERWSEITGFHQNDVEPSIRNWARLLRPARQSEIIHGIEQHMQGKTPIYQVEHQIRAKNGEWKWVFGTIKVVERDDDGQPTRAIGTHQDISDRKQVEQQLVRQERLAAVGQLAAGIAHDFNNMLASILLHADLLRRADVSDHVNKRIDAITVQSERAADLVSQILDFTQQTIRQTNAVDLATFLTDFISFIATTMPESIRISQSIPDDELTVDADETQLQQVVTNLAVNASHAMPDGGQLHFNLSKELLTKAATCSICGEPIAGEWICLAIQDSGSGIAGEILPHIFEPFFTTREAGKGSGLGLSQVTGIMEQHGGHVTVASKLDGGTTFNLYFKPTNLPAAASYQDQTVSLKGDGEMILLIEDEVAVLEAMTEMLEHCGYSPLPANSAYEAETLFAAHKHQIALVLSDMVMPDMNGESLFNRFRQEMPQLKMIIMSGYPLGQKGQTLLQKGLSGWLKKPATYEQVSRSINLALRAPDAERPTELNEK